MAILTKYPWMKCLNLLVYTHFCNAHCGKWKWQFENNLFSKHLDSLEMQL